MEREAKRAERSSEKLQIISTAVWRFHNLPFCAYAPSPRRCAASPRAGIRAVYAIMDVAIRRAAGPMLEVRMTQSTRLLLWGLLAVLAVIFAYLGFRGYFSPELLFNLSNAFSC
jgi:hypothetical protein